MTERHVMLDRDGNVANIIILDPEQPYDPPEGFTLRPERDGDAMPDHVTPPDPVAVFADHLLKSGAITRKALESAGAAEVLSRVDAIDAMADGGKVTR